MSERNARFPLVQAPPRRSRQGFLFAEASAPEAACPICGAMIEARPIGDKLGWICIAGGYAHYFQARYAHLEQWFTSGEGNLREPLIRAIKSVS